MVGPGGFEPPTSTMSRPIGRTKTRVDALKLVSKVEMVKRWLRWDYVSIESAPVWSAKYLQLCECEIRLLTSKFLSIEELLLRIGFDM